MGHSSFKNENLKLKLSSSGFTLVELLIVIAILGILSVTAYIGIQNSQVRVMNERVTSDLLAIQNALNQYKNDNGNYPTIGGALKEGVNKNILCFDKRHTYIHNCAEALFVQTQVDNELLTKRYIQEIPTDPRTGSRYAYAVTTDGQFFQLAGNHWNKDDTYQAEVVDNLDEGTLLPSMIRAFDGPDFIADGAPHLPYSPDAENPSARLYALAGTVTFDGEPLTEEGMLQAGAMIETGVDSMALIYFSDGSVTHLDESSQLRFLPSSEVVKNDNEGIITKIRLKLFQGKIWNKVVRMAEKSEFNVETTTAIAGVRGTEFGLEAETNKLTVYTGKLLARKKTKVEMEESNKENQYLNFTALEKDFLPSQETNSKQEQFFVYTIPEAQNPIPEPELAAQTEATELIEKYYKETIGLSLADVPYIVKAQGHADGTYSIYVTFNGLSPNDLVKIKGFEIYSQSQTTGIRLMKDGALENPLLTITDYVIDGEKGAYKFELDYMKTEKNPLYNKDTDQIESLLLRAFQENEAVTTHSQISWPPIGLPPEPKEEFAHEFDNAELYQEFAVMEEGQKGDIEITKLPPNLMNLDAAPIELISNKPCVWSIGPEDSGAFIGASENVDKVMYIPLKPDLNATEKGVNVTQRFKQSQQPLFIRCEDPMDKDNYHSVTFTIAYKPKSISGEYEYGYLAKNNVSWTAAHTACNSSTEGGFDDWTLPSKVVYEKLVQAKMIDAEKKNLCNLDINNKCEDLDLAYNFYLQEEQDINSGWTISLGNNILAGFEKNKASPSFVYRCAR